MPSDDLVLNVRQIAGYPPAAGVVSSDALIIQRGGLGGPYLTVDAEALVATALASPGSDMTVGGAVSAIDFSGGSAQFSNAFVNLFGAQTASIGNLAITAAGSLGGVQIATVNDLAALSAASVNSFNGRVGNVSLWIDDIRCAGGAPIYSPRFTGEPRACTPPPTSNSSRLATTAFVQGMLAQLTLDFAPLDSPNFTGVPTAPTPAQGSSDGSLATTAFVMNAVSDSVTGVATWNTRSGNVVMTAADVSSAGGALLASPAFTGLPAAPTAPPGTSTAQIATTAFVAAALAAAAAGVSSFNARTGAVTLTAADIAAVGVSSFNGRLGDVFLLGNDVSAAGGALLASPVFTGVPAAPTAIPATNTTQIATTAFVQAAVAVATSGVQSFNGRAGVVVLTAADLTGAGGALSASPTFTGVPAAPTAAPATNSTQLATTAFVQAAVAAATAGVASFNGRTGAVTLITNDISGAGGALLASPTFTGVPLAPTAAVGTATTQLATCAYVLNAASTTVPLMNGVAAAGNGTTWARSNHVHPVDTSRLAAAGVTNGSNAAAGVIGEVISALNGAGVGLPSSTATVITSINLTAGDWDVHGEANVIIGSSDCTSINAATSLSSTNWPGIDPTAGSWFALNMDFGAGTGHYFPLGTARISITTTTVVYLIMQATYTSGTAPTGYGSIWARRAR
jgi:hypothetical protein